MDETLSYDREVGDKKKKLHLLFLSIFYLVDGYKVLALTPMFHSSLFY